MTHRIWTEMEMLELGDSVDDLIKAMEFKAKHIRAKAEPELFKSVADTLRSLSEYIEVLHSKIPDLESLE